ncbi:MAG: hypothetical protein IT458_20485, partial [Planctomycetes bacterium]|nr:hypothetical protein [Planctomycetota bacterium]
MNARKILGASASAWALAGLLGAQTLVKDINTTPYPMDSSPGFGARVADGRTVFAATDPTAGRELWITDGTTAGTLLLKDINPGPTDANPTGFIRSSAGGNTRVYFSADDGVHGAELWRTDGTAAGTVLVFDIEPGSGGSAPSDFAEMTVSGLGVRLLFAAQDDRASVGTGRELWRSDGTSTGTAMVADLNPGTSDSNPSELTFLIDASANHRLVFRATVSGMGAELAATDGTTAGTRIVWDIRPGTSSSNPTGFVRFPEFDAAIPGHDRVFFAANDGTSGVELWSTNGLFSHRLELDILPGSGSSNPVLANEPHTTSGAASETLCFSARTTTMGRELFWIGPGNHAARDLRPGVDSGIADDARLCTVWNVCFVPVDDGVHGTELFLASGTPSSPDVGLFHEFTAGATGTVIRDLIGVSGGLFAVIGTGATARLWYSDGTAKLFVTGDVGINGVHAYSSTQVYYAGSTATPPTGFELRYTNTTGADRLVKDINPQLPGSSQAYGLLSVGTRMFFWADDGLTGHEPWVTDGTSVNTWRLRDIRPGSATSMTTSYAFTALGSRVLFRADDGTTGAELWISDGSSAGTIRVRDINPGSGASAPYRFATLGTVATFSATDGVNGYELWRTDGTAGGTYMLVDGWTGSGHGAPSQGVVHGGRIYFVIASPLYGRELWSTDGTVTGTQLVVDLNPGATDGARESDGRLLAVSAPWGSGVVFSGSNGVTGFEPYFTDGTAAGTRLVSDIYAGASSSEPGVLVKVRRSNGDQVYFEAANGTNGRELWTIGPTGTVSMVKDAYPGSGSGMANSAIVATDLGAYWVGTDSTNGWELWYSDFAGGANMVRDVNPGSASSMVVNRAVLCPVGSGDRLVFKANDGVTGEEIWLTDGTTAGTRRLFDLYSGPVGSNPQGVAQLGKEVLFSANDEVYGHELWKMPLT